MRLALFEPDIPQNAGAIARLGACLGVPVDIIGPAGFVMTDAKYRRAGLDYADRATLTVHENWHAFCDATGPGCRLLLLTTAGDTDYRAVRYAPGDVLILGRESAGAPGFVHEAAAFRLAIPLAAGMRSLNVATAAALVLGEALRQTRGFPGDRPHAPYTGAPSRHRAAAQP